MATSAATSSNATINVSVTSMPVDAAPMIVTKASRSVLERSAGLTPAHRNPLDDRCDRRRTNANRPTMVLALSALRGRCPSGRHAGGGGDRTDLRGLHDIRLELCDRHLRAGSGDRQPVGRSAARRDAPARRRSGRPRPTARWGDHGAGPPRRARRTRAPSPARLRQSAGSRAAVVWDRYPAPSKVGVELVSPDRVVVASWTRPMVRPRDHLGGYARSRTCPTGRHTRHWVTQCRQSYARVRATA